jgi:hypothetical protein
MHTACIGAGSARRWEGWMGRVWVGSGCRLAASGMHSTPSYIGPQCGYVDCDPLLDRSGQQMWGSRQPPCSKAEHGCHPSDTLMPFNLRTPRKGCTGAWAPCSVTGTRRAGFRPSALRSSCLGTQVHALCFVHSCRAAYAHSVGVANRSIRCP